MTKRLLPPVPLHQRPLGQSMRRPGVYVLLVLAILALPLIAWRFAAGLGAVTGLNDGYPWGIWIVLDVLTGTALASGGFAVALLVYILNRWKYHPLVRPAMLTAALGYSMALLSLVIDVGRPWHFWKVPVQWGDWNLDSALLEVALCMAAYTFVLWIEVSPALLERFEASARPRLRAFGGRATELLHAALPWVIAVGVLLPMMHQSSLGTLMVLTGHKLDPLWQTPLLPALFLLSSFLMGLGAVVLESTFASLFFRRPLETRLLGALARVARVAAAAFLVLHVGDCAVRGVLGRTLAFDGPALAWWAECALFAAPVVLLTPRRRRDPGLLLRGAILVLLAGALYRFDAFLVAFHPGAGWSYFPTVPEMLIVLGLVAMEILAYVALVNRFPILRGEAAATPT